MELTVLHVGAKQVVVGAGVPLVQVEGVGRRVPSHQSDIFVDRAGVESMSGIGQDL